MTRKNKDLRKELDALKKKAENAFGRRLPEPEGGSLFKPASMGGGVSRDAAVKRDDPAAEIIRPEGTLTDLVSGVMTRAGEGSFYRVLAGAETISEGSPSVHEEYLKAIGEDVYGGTAATPGGFPAGRKELEGLRPLLETRPEEICYLDIETTGLSNTPLFLVGLMYSQMAAGSGDAKRLVLDLLFARDYTEERMVLLFLSEIFSRFTTLVTFNGIGFDMPFIMDRMATHRIACTPPATHVDLLKVARKAVGKRTPNHKLQTLEVFLLGRKRKGDIPGSRIPGAYHEFVRTGNAGEMAAVIHHNRLDLYSMLELVTLFLSGR